MAKIELANLSKRFGKVVAVDTLDLVIEDQEFVALLGPSGCGKTTTMNMIAGVLHPDQGEIRFDGRDVRNVAPGKRDVGFVFQNYAIFTHMTVFKNISFGLEIRKLPKAEIEQRVREIADLVGLTGRLDHSAARLGVNEMQRLAIARSAITNPKIFLLDEPLSNLDAAFRAQMRTELKHLQHRLEQTMVYVTHDQLEAMSMADRVAVMHDGKLQQYGTPLEVYNQPRNTFVARFMGSPSMNLLNCRLTTQADVPNLDFDGIGRLAVTDPSLLALCGQTKTAQLILGVRPEAVVLKAPGDSSAALALSVGHVERIAARTIVHLERGDHVVKAVERNGYPVAIGDVLEIDLAPGKARLFDAASGLALEAG